MELDKLKELIKKHEAFHQRRAIECEVAERYYRNETDVLYQPKKNDDEGNPIRNADNRIPANFHGLLVNQKAAYAFTAPPLFDVGNTSSNQRITELLGDEYAKNCNQLCVNASNCSVGWVHYWQGDDGFEWGVVPTAQVIPIWGKSLKRKLLGVLRIYNEIDDKDGNEYIVYEYWTDKECEMFRRKSSSTLDDGLTIYNAFTAHTSNDETNLYTHGFEDVPFIPFFNNNIGTSDLNNIKKLIDVYDKVFSGFINDLDDIQEIIFILTAYGGEDKQEFIQDLKKYKMIKLDADDGADAKTLSIEIPIEARNSVLETTRKAIFMLGQGFDPQPENFGNQSGEALKFMYSMLEMKVGLMETEFKLGFAKLVRVMCKSQGIKCGTIIQTWTRTAVKNEKELSEICKNSVGIVSKKTILKNHPFVEDADAEIKQISAEQKEEEKQFDPYSDVNPSGGE